MDIQDGETFLHTPINFKFKKPTKKKKKNIFQKKKLIFLNTNNDGHYIHDDKNLIFDVYSL